MRQTQSISIQQVIDQPDAFDAVIDVRAPGEFLLDHMPGAVSHPVLSDAQRAEIGTLHKQVSGFAAKRRGAVLVARNIAQAIETHFADMPQQWRPLIYCWRGGQRSNSMGTIFARIGWKASVLEGGYKAYRARVLSDLDTIPAQLQWRVLCGRTGTGKSLVLAELKRLGAQILDLEQLALHRGSLLGHLPDTPQPAQKWFDSQIWDALRKMDSSKPIYVESESKKIGAVQVPAALMDAMRNSACLEVVSPLQARVELLLEHYRHFTESAKGFERLIGQVDCLTALHGTSTVDGWKDLAAKGQWEEFVAALLEQHYDPAYDKSIDRNFVQRSQGNTVTTNRLDAQGIAQLAQAILAK